MGLRLVIGPPFSFIGLSQADDSDPIRGFKVTKGVKALVKVPKGDPAVLSVILSLIKSCQRGFKFKVSGTFEGNSPEFDIPLVLGGVEGDLHPQSVSTKRIRARPIRGFGGAKGILETGGLTPTFRRCPGGTPVGDEEIVAGDCSRGPRKGSVRDRTQC